MTRLFFEDIRALAIRVYRMAGKDETKYPDQAGNVLADITDASNNPGSREVLAVRGLAAEAITVAALLRTGRWGIGEDGKTLVLRTNMPEPPEPPVTVVIDEVDAEIEAPVVISVELSDARDFLGTAKIVDRFGVPRPYLSLEVEDFDYLYTTYESQESGNRVAKERVDEVRQILRRAEVNSIDELPTDDQILAAELLRSRGREVSIEQLMS